MAQDIQVLGKRNEKDKLSDINLTRSICLNDLTQEQLARLYKKGVMTFSDFFSGCKLFYNCQYRGKTILLNVERVMFDSANQTVVFECGYSMVHDKYFRVLLNKDADGQYLLSPRVSDVPWLTSDDLKTVNGQSLVGTGDIEIAAGNKTGYIYFRFMQCSSIADWRDNMDEIGVYIPSLLGSNEGINTTLSCYCKVQDDGHYQIVPFSLMKYDGRFHIFLTMFKPSENVWRRYDISADTWENIIYSQSLTITYTTLNNGQ